MFNFVTLYIVQNIGIRRWSEKESHRWDHIKKFAKERTSEREREREKERGDRKRERERKFKVVHIIVQP